MIIQLLSGNKREVYRMNWGGMSEKKEADLIGGKGVIKIRRSGFFKLFDVRVKEIWIWPVEVV